MEKLLSFHGDPAIKDEHIANLSTLNLGELIKSNYEYDCREEYDNWPVSLGIPKRIACIRDAIFEELSYTEQVDFLLTFSQAIPVGVDLDNVWRKFIIWILTDPTNGVSQYVTDKNLVQAVADLYTRSLTEDVSNEESESPVKVIRAATEKNPHLRGAVHSPEFWAHTAADAAGILLNPIRNCADTASWVYESAAAAVCAHDSGAWAEYGEDWHTAASKKLIELLKEAQ
jgi:hypothetical protein